MHQNMQLRYVHIVVECFRTWKRNLRPDPLAPLSPTAGTFRWPPDLVAQSVSYLRVNSLFSIPLILHDILEGSFGVIVHHQAEEQRRDLSEQKAP